MNQFLRTAKYGDAMLKEGAERGENLSKIEVNNAIRNGTFDTITLGKQFENIGSYKARAPASARTPRLWQFTTGT